MKSRLVHASLWAVAGSGLQYVSLFVLLVYLTRILNPRDFGLMATLSIGLDLGLRVARWGQIELLQQPGNRSDAIRNHAFRLSLWIACGPAFLFIATAWPLGRYFDSPELTTMSLLCAPAILFSAAGSTPEAVLRNDFRFKQIAYKNTVCTLAGGAVAIVMALRGFGALSLAAQQLTQATLGSIWLWAAVSWRPSFDHGHYYDPTAARDGGSIMVGSLLPQLIPRSFDLCVGVFMGPVALGIMRVANRFNDFVGQMVLLPLSTVASAQIPRFSASRNAMRTSYLQLTQASAAIACPVLLGIGLVAQEAVPLIFGPHWQASIPIVQISSLLALVTPISFYFAPAMIALGKRRVIVRQSVLDVTVGVSLAIVAAGTSLQAVALAAVVRCAFTSICNAGDLSRHFDLPMTELARHLAAPYVAVLIMAASVTGTRFALDDRCTPSATLLMLSFMGAISYTAAIFIGARLRLWPDYDRALRRLFPRFATSR